GMLGALGCCFAMIGTVTIIPFIPDGWDAAAGFPAMKGNVAFLMKDVVLLAAAFYLLKQDLVRAALPPAQQRPGPAVAPSRDRADGAPDARERCPWRGRCGQAGTRHQRHHRGEPRHRPRHPP